MTNLEMLKVVLGLVAKDATITVKDEDVNVHEWLADYIDSLEDTKNKRNAKAAERRATKWEEDNAELIDGIKDVIASNKDKTEYTYKELADAVNEAGFDVTTTKIMAIVKKVDLGVTVKAAGKVSSKQSDETKRANINILKSVIVSGKSYTYEQLTNAIKEQHNVDFTTSKITNIIKNWTGMDKNVSVSKEVVKTSGKSKKTMLTIKF